jgi:hypothetical protein
VQLGTLGCEMGCLIQIVEEKASSLGQGAVERATSNYLCNDLYIITIMSLICRGGGRWVIGRGWWWWCTGGGGGGLKKANRPRCGCWREGVEFKTARGTVLCLRRGEWCELEVR